MRTSLALWGFFLLITTAQAQDTAIVRNDYALAVQEAQAGKKVVLAILDSKDLELPATMDAALVDNLIGLLCDNCHLTRFPKGLEACPNLRAVEINWYLFGDSPDNRPLLEQLFQVPHLEQLTIHAFPVPDVPFKSRALQRLEWTKGSLTVVPAWVYEQTALKSLRLGCNNLTRIDEALGNLTALEYFSLGGGACGGNPIKRLPQSLKQLQQLKAFDLSYGALEVFPSAFWELPHLERLSFHYAGLVTIPDDIPTGTALRSFRLSATEEFLGFPPSFANLQLERLFVDVYKPTCAAIQSQSLLEQMESTLDYYDVQFRGTPFPDYMHDDHVTNQIIGVWKASKAFTLVEGLESGQYLFLPSSYAYLSQTIAGIPPKGSYGKAVFDYANQQALLYIHDLHYAQDCVFGKIKGAIGTAAAQKREEEAVHFSFAYDAEQDVLQLTLATGVVVELVRVQ